MKKAVSLVDTLRWTDADGSVCEFEGKGDTVELPDGEFDRLEAAGAVAKAGNSGASSGGWPSTHDELDALADGVEGIAITPGEGKKKSTWNDGTVKTAAEKVAALEAAGVPQPTSEEA